MLPSTNIQSIIGATLFGPDEEKIGRIAQVLVDAGDGHPTWAEVHVGALGRHSTFVPLHDATWENDNIYVPHSKELVTSAPRPDAGEGLDPAQEHELTRHYSGQPPAAPVHTQPHDSESTGTDATTPPTEKTAQELDDDGVLWEERLVVSKEKVPVAKVHLETTTVTEEHQITADVQKERIAVDQSETTPRPRD